MSVDVPRSDNEMGVFVVKEVFIIKGRWQTLWVLDIYNRECVGLVDILGDLSVVKSLSV